MGQTPAALAASSSMMANGLAIKLATTPTRLLAAERELPSTAPTLGSTLSAGQSARELLVFPALSHGMLGLIWEASLVLTK